MGGLATVLAVAAAGIGAGAADRVDRLSAGQLAGQRVVAGFHGYTPPRDLLRRIRRGKVGGVILFADNVAQSRARVRAAIGRLDAAARRGRRPKVLVMIDQEGGPVRRIPGAPV